jgi:hypothetical protein
MPWVVDYLRRDRPAVCSAFYATLDEAAAFSDKLLAGNTDFFSYNGSAPYFVDLREK